MPGELNRSQTNALSQQSLELTFGSAMNSQVKAEDQRAIIQRLIDQQKEANARHSELLNALSSASSHSFTQSTYFPSAQDQVISRNKGVPMASTASSSWMEDSLIHNLQLCASAVSRLSRAINTIAQGCPDDKMFEFQDIPNIARLEIQASFEVVKDKVESIFYNASQTQAPNPQQRTQQHQEQLHLAEQLPDPVSAVGQDERFALFDFGFNTPPTWGAATQSQENEQRSSGAPNAKEPPYTFSVDHLSPPGDRGGMHRPRSKSGGSGAGFEGVVGNWRSAGGPPLVPQGSRKTARRAQQPSTSPRYPPLRRYHCPVADCNFNKLRLRFPKDVRRHLSGAHKWTSAQCDELSMDSVKISAQRLKEMQELSSSDLDEEKRPMKKQRRENAGPSSDVVEVILPTMSAAGNLDDLLKGWTTVEV